MTLLETFMGLGITAFILAGFFAMFLIIFRNTNYPCIEDEEKEKEK